MRPGILAMLVFAGSAAALAACGGGATVTPTQGRSTPTPGPTSTATATPTPVPTSTATATPTPVPTSTATATPGSASFTGGTQTVSFTPSGGTFTVSPADATYSGSITFGADNATAAYNFKLSWATFAQITGTFAPGQLTASIGTALLYLDFNSASTVSFTQTPAITVTTTGSFPGTKCGFSVYANNSGTGAQWNSMPSLGIAEVTPSGSTFSIPAAALPPGNTVDFQANRDQYIALYCH